MQYITIKTVCKKEKSPNSSLIRDNQNMTDYFRYNEIKFKNHQEAFVYFKNYYLFYYNYNGSIKIKIKNYR